MFCKVGQETAVAVEVEVDTCGGLWVDTVIEKQVKKLAGRAKKVAKLSLSLLFLCISPMPAAQSKSISMDKK